MMVTLIVYNSKNIPKVEVSFKDIFPSLSGLAYAQDATDVEYLERPTFRFMYYEFKNAHK